MGMREHEMSRTLVKSPPELWEECSQASSFARHLSGSFGEITITRLEPETAVAWEGEGASGTVRIEPSGWGTRVTLTAAVEEQEAAENQRPPVIEEPDEAAETPTPDPLSPPTTPDPPARRRLMARVLAFFRPDAVEADAPPTAEETEPAAGDPIPAPELAVTPPPEGDGAPSVENHGPESDSVSLDAETVLAAALDSLGQAHHRPFSRS